MAPVRVRHAGGVSTIQVPFGDESFTVEDLQQEISSLTGIPGSKQLLKSGYPPRHLTLVPQLPVSSLGLQPGDQIIVGQAPSASTIDTGPDHVQTPDGTVLVHRVVPDDNSCLFSAIALIFVQDISKASQIRQIVADGIQRDPETFNQAILGMPPSKYISAMLKPTTWGGAIELAVFANWFNTEIDSIDVETGRIDRFEPSGRASGNRCILIYSGIHYDAATLAPVPDAPRDWHQTVFPITTSDDSDPVLVAAKKLADILRAKRAYTNTATFDLKCQQCGQGLKGEKGARAHAEQTGHTRFGEY